MAPVRWTLGQSLLPEHFVAQEESLRDEFKVRLGYIGAPLFGVARLTWDNVQLGRGVIQINDLTLVLPSGQLLDIPGNCDPVAFDLESVGTSHVQLHIAWTPDHVPDPTHQSSHQIDRVRSQAALVGVRMAHIDAELFHLADFSKNLEGVWHLDLSYIPPSIGIVGTPFFLPILERLDEILNSFHETLIEDVRTNYLARQLHISAQQSLREVFKLKGKIADCVNGLDIHPYELYQMARSLYVDMSIYREVQPLEANTPYLHQKKGSSFGTILDALSVLVGSDTRKSGHYTPFEQTEGLLRCKLPDEAKQGKELYLLVQKQSTGQRIELDRVKFASPSRLASVQRRALRGVPYQPIERPPFHHDFGSEVEFYAFTLGQEWDHVIHEGTLATYERPELAKVHLFLLWR